MQETLTFPTLAASPSRFAFPDPQYYDHQFLYSPISSAASTPFVSAPSSPSTMKGFYFSAPTSPTWVQRTLQMQEDDHEDGSPNWAEEKLQIKDGGRPDCAQKSQQMKGGSCPRCAQIITREMKHDSCTHWVPMPAQPMKNDATRHKAHIRLLIEDADASSIPYASEEKPDSTPKTRANFEANNNSEEDSSSILLSGSSEFEFSARFSEVEEPPMSPTPISSSSSYAFKHHAHGISPGPPSELAYGNHKHNEAAYEEPVRPPPRLANPVRRLTCKDEAVEIKHSSRSLTSLSAPQSPCSPGKFGLRRTLCGISNPTDTAFDPYLAAMEKMEKNSDVFSVEVMANDVSKNTRNSRGQHSRAQSSSPLSIFHWDEHSSKSNSSSNDSFMHEIKRNHHNQKNINGPSSSKGLKRWSFKGFFHRKSTNDLPAEASRSSNTTSLRSSGRSSCSSSMEESNDVNIMDDNAKVRGVNMDDNAKVRGVNMDANARIRGLNVDDNAKFRSINSPVSRSNQPSIPPPPSSSSPSGSGSTGKLTGHKVIKGPYALHYTMQRAHTEQLRKRTFLPYKQGLFGCLGFSSKSYRTITTLSKPLQSVS